MRPDPDPLKAHADAVAAGDTRLAALIAARLFPWVRRGVRMQAGPQGAREALRRLRRMLGI